MHHSLMLSCVSCYDYVTRSLKTVSDILGPIVFLQWFLPGVYRYQVFIKKNCGNASSPNTSGIVLYLWMTLREGLKCPAGADKSLADLKQLSELLTNEKVKISQACIDASGHFPRFIYSVLHYSCHPEFVDSGIKPNPVNHLLPASLIKIPSTLPYALNANC